LVNLRLLLKCLEKNQLRLHKTFGPVVLSLTKQYFIFRTPV
jgi:hypothetical protein